MSEKLSVMIIAEGNTHEEIAEMVEEAAALVRRKRQKGRTFTDTGEFRFNIQNASEIKSRKKSPNSRKRIPRSVMDRAE